MGFYIEVPNMKNKAKQLVELCDAEIVSEPVWDKDKGLICVVDNGPWEAAAYAYDEAEFMEFQRYDGRSKTWLVMNKLLASKLSGYS